MSRESAACEPNESGPGNSHDDKTLNKRTRNNKIGRELTAHRQQREADRRGGAVTEDVRVRGAQRDGRRASTRTNGVATPASSDERGRCRRRQRRARGAPGEQPGSAAAASHGLRGSRPATTATTSLTHGSQGETEVLRWRHVHKKQRKP